jgi:hypothetical protein
MSNRLNNSEIMFSHRPQAGISVGVYSDGNNLYFAAALVNDGSSRSGIMYPDRRDRFSRPMAQNIIRGRLEAMMAGREVPYGVTFNSVIEAREFMQSFRDKFKPEHNNNDHVTHDFADAMFDEVVKMANEVVADIGVNV